MSIFSLFRLTLRLSVKQILLHGKVKPSTVNLQIPWNWPPQLMIRWFVNKDKFYWLSVLFNVETAVRTLVHFCHFNLAITSVNLGLVWIIEILLEEWICGCNQGWSKASEKDRASSTIHTANQKKIHLLITKALCKWGHWKV